MGEHIINRPLRYNYYNLLIEALRSELSMRNDQRLQGLPPLSPLDIFNKHSMHHLQHSPSQMTSHQLTSTPTAVPLLQQIVDRERHESASTDRESEIRRIFDQGNN